MNRGVTEASATESLIERLKAATMGFDWADLPDDAAIPAVPLLREAAAELEALRSRCERMEMALKPFVKEAERGANWQTLKPCEKHPDRYCNCEGFYPACREAPASTARALQQGDGALDGGGR